MAVIVEIGPSSVCVLAQGLRETTTLAETGGLSDELIECARVMLELAAVDALPVGPSRCVTALWILRLEFGDVLGGMEEVDQLAACGSRNVQLP